MSRGHPDLDFLKQAVLEWLRDSRLEPEAWPELEFIEVAVIPDNNDGRPVFTQPTVRIQAGEAGGVRIRWELAEAEAIVDESRPRATVYLTPSVYPKADLFLRSMMVVVLVFALRRRGRFHVHGAALESPQGVGWLLAGTSGGGKSTTAALLARQGWRVATEDIAFVEPLGTGEVAVRGFRTRLALRAGGAALLEVAGGVDLTGRGKLGLWPEELGGRWIPRIVPRVILFTTVGEDRTVVEPIGPMEAMRGLIQWSMWILFESLGSSEHLQLLTSLASQARAYRVQLGRDLFERPDLLQEAVG